MCIAPTTIYSGPRGDTSRYEVACHKCWQCRENAINDWVGRNIAETKTSKAVHAVTLTYGRDMRGEVNHERASLLTYSDVQKYLKRLRKVRRQDDGSRHGYPVRYFVTGEFGSKKGRAHWHIMLYWQQWVPPFVLDKNFMEQHWDHGWSYWTDPTPNAVRYNCKYIQKGMGEEDLERQGHLGMSRKPPLGARYFQQLAERYVAEGLAPQSLEYSFPDVKRRKESGRHEIVRFRLKDRSASLFLQHYLGCWYATHPGKSPPASPLLRLFEAAGDDNGDAFEWVEGENGVLRPMNRSEWREWTAERMAKQPKPDPVIAKPFGFEWYGWDGWQAAFERENGIGDQQQQEAGQVLQQLQRERREAFDREQRSRAKAERERKDRQ